MSVECVRAQWESEGAAKNKMYIQSRESVWGAAQSVKEQSSIQGEPQVRGQHLVRSHSQR